MEEGGLPSGGGSGRGRRTEAGGGGVRLLGEQELVVVPTTHPGGHLGHVIGAPMWRSRKEADAFLCSQVFYDLVGPSWPEPGCGVQAPDLFLGAAPAPRCHCRLGSPLTWLSRPGKMSIMKNKVAQRGERGIMVTALG